MLEGLLPIGSVVLLKESEKRIMVAGVCQKGGSDPNKIWDYCGILYPEGFIGSDKMFLFDSTQIEQIFALGYQDAEQLAFKVKADMALAELKSEEIL